MTQQRHCEKVSLSGSAGKRRGNLTVFMFCLIFPISLFAKSAQDFIAEVESAPYYQASSDVVTTTASYLDAPYVPADQMLPPVQLEPPRTQAGSEIMHQQLMNSIQKLTGKIERLENRLMQLEEKTGFPTLVAANPRTQQMPEIVPAQKAPALPIKKARDATVQSMGTISSAALGAQAHIPYPEGAKALYDHAYSLMTSEDLVGAKEAFKALVKKHPTHALAGEAYFWWGDIYFVEQNYDQAAKKFLTGYQQYRASPKAPKMLLKLAMTLDQLGDKSKACTTLRKLKSEYPNAPNEVLQHGTNIQEKLRCPG